MTGRSAARAIAGPAPPPGRPLRHEGRHEADRLRAAIERALAGWCVATPAGIGAALGMRTDEAVALVRRTSWREGDLRLLRTAAARLGLA